ncbi:MAG TPA: acyltransferase [Bryobacteraceae bacterium]|jgi:acetyltransferase-like isoleucine patch superfamily enzyme|nr:acyltransferase [Bryobacteraceae bacterium]
MTGQDLGSLYTADELRQTLGSVGENVAVNRSVVFYSPKNIHVGSNSRIDCFCILSASSHGIVIGDHVHISAYVALFGASGSIRVESFCALSSRVSVFTSTDDYVEGYMSNPTVPPEYRKGQCGDVVFQKHALIGCGSVIMPGVTVEVGGSVGALSFVNKNVSEFAIVVGIPCRVIGQRNRRLLELEAAFLAKYD